MAGYRDTREALDATKRVLKTTQRSLRTCGQMLADLEERLETLENAQPNGGTANGHSNEEERSRPRDASAV